jgi:cell division protein FtsB
MNMLTKAQLDSVTFQDVQNLRRMKELYSTLTEILSLKQFTTLMGGDMSYKSKAERAKRVSKSKRVHCLADQIIELYAQIKRGGKNE